MTCSATSLGGVDGKATVGEISSPPCRPDFDHLVSWLRAEAVNQCPAHRLADGQVVAIDDNDVCMTAGGIAQRIGQIQSHGSVPIQSRKQQAQERSEPLP